MRGAHVINDEDDWMLRIIPADAGSTRKLIQITAQVQDHPRGCGEHLTRRNRGKLQCGSSPRMRGAQCHSMPRM